MPKKISLAGACVADMRRLLVGDIQALAEDFPVSAGLVQKVHKIAVFKDVLDFREESRSLMFCVIPVGIPPHLRKRFQISTLQVPTSPRSRRWNSSTKYQVEFALIPVLGNTVPHLILDHQHTQAFELLSQPP